MTEEIKMEWEEWRAKYQPLMIDAGMDDGDIMEFDNCQDAHDYVKEHMTCVPEYQIGKHVWTTTGGDGWDYTSTGYHVCDRMHCYVCLVPWVKEYEACMYHEEEGSWCDECDGYTVECEHDDDDWQDKADTLAEEQANE